MDAYGEEKHRLKLVFAAGAVVTVVVTLLALFLIDDDPNATPEPKSYSLSSSDKADIGTVTSFFLEEAGGFGVRDSAVTPDTILSLREQISQAPASTIFLPRTTVYSSLKKNYIAAGSPLDFTSITDWSDAYLIENMVTAKTEDVKLNVPDDGYYRPGEVKAVRVNVSFTSHQVARLQTATDTSWDGTYDILEIKAPTTASVVLTKKGDEWRVYAVENLNDRSLLAITPLPTSDMLPAPTKIGSIKTTVEIPTANEPVPPVS